MNPYIIPGEVSIPSGLTQNVLTLIPAAERFIRNRFAAEVQFTAVQSAVGLLVDLYYSAKNVVDSCPLRVSTTIREQFDTINDQYYVKPGTLNILRVNNTTGGAITLNFKLAFQPIPVNKRGGDKLIMGINQSIGAAASDVNVLDGRNYEYPVVPSLVSVFDTGSATGLTKRFEIESRTLVPDSDVNPANRFPINPDDMSIAGLEVGSNDRMLMPVSNPTGGALDYQALVQLLETQAY